MYYLVKINGKIFVIFVDRLLELNDVLSVSVVKVVFNLNIFGFFIK